MKLLTVMNDVYKPIFIVGGARSGTTLLYNILSQHKELAYVNRNITKSRVYINFPYTKKWRMFISIDRNRYFRIIVARLLNKLYRDKYNQEPTEADYLFARYMGTYRYVTEKDYVHTMDELVEDIYYIQKVFNKSRFINKNPHHPFRVRLLNRIFPNAKFINIIRDGRAVAYSLYMFEKTTPNAVAQNLKKIVGEKYDDSRSKLYNYGLAWEVIVSRSVEIRYLAKENRYYEIRYEDLISKPKEIIRDLIDFCELEWYETFKNSIPKMRNENIKWKMLSDEEKNDLEESTSYIRSILEYA